MLTIPLGTRAWVDSSRREFRLLEPATAAN
jgi:hypothetical protein